MKQIGWILSFWLAISYGCDPCADCGEPLRYDPTVKVIFINQDSAVALLSMIDDVNDSTKQYDSLSAYNTGVINDLKDSLIAIKILIDSGKTDHVDIQLEFENLVDSLTTANDTIKSWNRRLARYKTVLNTTLSNIRSGNLQIEKLELLENGAVLTYEDSIKSYNLPLLLAEQQTTFLITIDNKTYTLGFEYITYETIDDARRVYVEVANTDTTTHTFDSLNISCRTSECISDETTVTAYF